MKKLRIICLSLLLVTVMISPASARGGRFYYHNQTFKNVIVMVPDGCDAAVQTLARWMKGSALQVDTLPGGGVKIHMANSVITGSAAAATAFACGEKTTVPLPACGLPPRDWQERSALTFRSQILWLWSMNGGAYPLQRRM